MLSLSSALLTSGREALSCLHCFAPLAVHLQQQIFCSLTEDGRRDALSTLVWFPAKLLTSPAASKSNTGGLLQKIASPGMPVCCRAGVQN